MTARIDRSQLAHLIETGKVRRGSQIAPPQPGRAARRRHVNGRMNRTEAAWELNLKALQQDGVVADFWFEPFNLRLAGNTYYRPDFLVQLDDGTLEVHEVKGHWEDDARVKIKVAANMFPFRFIAIRKVKGSWEREVIGPDMTRPRGGRAKANPQDPKARTNHRATEGTEGAQSKVVGV